MKYLLDTHTFIWWHDNPQALSEKVLRICEDVDSDLFLSMASIWEMQIKLQLNKLELSSELSNIIALQQQNGIALLPITTEHILGLSTLPSHHKDPFDRLLISQSKIEHAVLLSKDLKFDLYDVNVQW